MKLPGITKLKQKQMVGVDCIKILQNYKNKNYWVHYCKVEEDLIYFNFGWEYHDPEDCMSFETIELGLLSIKDFINYVKSRKSFVKKFCK